MTKLKSEFFLIFGLKAHSTDFLSKKKCCSPKKQAMLKKQSVICKKVSDKGLNMLLM